jgi:O-antigen/teichoic acid export membrane protein
MISAFFGEDNLGLFAQMNKYIKAPIVLITSAVSQIFYVEVSKAINDKRFIMPYLKQAIKTTIFFAIPFSLVILFFAPQLFSIYLGKKFIDYGLAGEMAQAILPILFLMFIISPISGLPILFKKQTKAFSMSLFGYGIAILGLFVGDFYNLTIFNSLIIYSCMFSIYYIMLLLWYIKMIKSHDFHLKV